jgi:AcrR family transcriptional regulator
MIPKEQILLVSAELFAKLGYATTTTRDIAAAAGIRQPTLFHHFESKRVILETLVERMVTRMAERLEAADGRWRRAGADVALYCVIRTDIYHLATDTYSIGTFISIREIEAMGFTQALEERAKTERLYRSIVQRGIRSGIFHVGNKDITVKLIFGMVESILVWLQRAKPSAAASAATEAADLVLSSLLGDRRGLAKIHAFLQAEDDLFPPAGA